MILRLDSKKEQFETERIKMNKDKPKRKTKRIHVHIPWDIIHHYNDVIMGPMASEITSLTIVYSTVYSGGDQRKHQSFASLAFVWGIHRWPVNSPHKEPVTRKMFPFDDVIMMLICGTNMTYWVYHVPRKTNANIYWSAYFQSDTSICDLYSVGK